MENLNSRKLRLAVTLVAKAILPLVINAYYAYLRNQQLLLDNLRRQLLPSVAAFIANSLSKSLASVQRSFAYPLHFLPPSRAAIEQTMEVEESMPERSVTCQVLVEPHGEPLADVVFIHGLHGGLDRTWKQGMWGHSDHKLKDQRPVRRVSSGDLHVPARKRSLKRAISGIYARTPSKRFRKSDSRPFGLEEDWEVVDGSEGEDGSYSPCWPQDWLPSDCPEARVIAVNYTTDVLWCPVWVKKRERTGMVERSREMIDELLKIGVGKHPIIWVGHSKGGLFIKQIILTAYEDNENQEDIINLYKQSKGIMFYSVPHRGSSLADFTLPLLRRSIELLEIQRNCDFVLDLHKRFVKVLEGKSDVEIFSFIETSFTLMRFIFLKIVAYESADPGIGTKCDVPLDHREICKPAGRDCFLYRELVQLINKCIYKNNNIST